MQRKNYSTKRVRLQRGKVDSNISTGFKILKIFAKFGAGAGVGVTRGALVGHLGGPIGIIAGTLIGAVTGFGVGLGVTAAGNKLSTAYDPVQSQLGGSVLSLNDVKKEGVAAIIGGVIGAGIDFGIDNLLDFTGLSDVIQRIVDLSGNFAEQTLSSETARKIAEYMVNGVIESYLHGPSEKLKEELQEKFEDIFSVVKGKNTDIKRLEKKINDLKEYIGKSFSKNEKVKVVLDYIVDKIGNAIIDTVK